MSTGIFSSINSLGLDKIPVIGHIIGNKNNTKYFSSINKAAKTLNINSSSISRQIVRKLKRPTGCKNNKGERWLFRKATKEEIEKYG